MNDNIDALSDKALEGNNNSKLVLQTAAVSLVCQTKEGCEN
jgi:hypothetical protein